MNTQARIDIAVCLKQKILQAMPSDIAKFLYLESTEIYHQPEGTMFLFRDYKWHIESNKQVQCFYEFLDEHDEADFKLVVASSALGLMYDDCDSWYGSWNDNPWNVRRVVRISLEFSNRGSSSSSTQSTA
jgi:hypothetical protein